MEINGKYYIYYYFKKYLDLEDMRHNMDGMM